MIIQQFTNAIHIFTYIHIYILIFKIRSHCLAQARYVVVVVVSGFQPEKAQLL